MFKKILKGFGSLILGILFSVILCVLLMIAVEYINVEMFYPQYVYMVYIILIIGSIYYFRKRSKLFVLGLILGLGVLFALQVYIKRGVQGKPVIYLYPTKEESVLVKLDYQGDFIATYPTYDEKIKGWNVTAFPDGRIIDVQGNEYSYLFWDGVASKPIDYDFSRGFVVKGEDSAEFLRETLSKMGLLPKEYNEFIVYWYPLMKKNKYNLVHFAAQEYQDIAKLEITPSPDSMLRVFMAFKSVKENINIEPQEIKSFERKGFAVIEWGGSEIK